MIRLFHTCLFLLLTTHLGALDLTAGASELITFPKLPKTAAKKESAVRIWLPDNYTTEKEFPMFLWFGGGSGGQGGNPKLVKNNDFICLGMPLYKKDIKEHVLLKPHDVQYAWPFYQQMFDNVFELVPNIQKHGGLVGGFSNGAHNTGLLMTEGDPVFNTWFDSYIFWEGGHIIKDFSIFKDRHSIWIMGDQSQAYGFMSAFAPAAEKAGSKMVSITMKGVGHKMHADYKPQVMDWIENKIVLGKVYEQYALMQKAMEAEKHQIAAAPAFFVATSAREHMSERSDAMKALGVINKTADAAYAELTADDPDSDDLKEFIQTWPHTAAADKAAQPLNGIGMAELNEILSSRKPERELPDFIEEWQGFEPGTAAQKELDKLAQKELNEILAEDDLKDKVKGLFDFADDWEAASQAADVEQIYNKLAQTELDRIRGLEEARDQARALKKWGKLFAKSAHAETAMEMMKSLR